MNALRITYLHGWRSAHQPTSQKIQFLERFCAAEGHTLQTPTIPYEKFCTEGYAASTGRSISGLLESLCRDSDVIMGTSLGGYFAQTMAAKLDKACILVNPAKLQDVVQMLVKEDQVVENYVTGEKTRIDKNVGLCEFSHSQIFYTRPPTLVLLGADDIVINPQSSMFAFHGKAEVRMFPGIDHRFSELEIAEEYIRLFLNNLSL